MLTKTLYTLQNLVATGASYLLQLVAASELRIHDIEAAHPFVAQAVLLAQKEANSVPVIAAAETVAEAVLAFARVMASSTSVAAANASTAPVTPPAAT